MKGQVAKEQEPAVGRQVQPPQQEAGTEGEAKEATKTEAARKRTQLRFIGNTLAGWPDEGKASEIFRSFQPSLIHI